MKRFPRAVLTSVLWRSLLIQGSWNYRSLIGNGFAYALLPALRYIYRNRPDELAAAVTRHTELFNSHPYLSPLALGAVSTLEAVEPPEVVARFKAAVRGSLGTLGDRLVWAGWRPICALFALLLGAVGAPWWLVVLSFLGIYNAGHIALRWWSFRFGFQHGKHVGEELRKTPVQKAQHLFDFVGALLVGALLPLMIARPALPGWGGMLWTVALAIAALLGLTFGGRVRTPVALVLSLATLLALLVDAL
ncbi:MAG TPA: PTS system mannose/fructose/sorbose family transporter subunit IID [Longimicrobiales bacterium]